MNGTALGGGFEIALACDLIFAAERAVFGLPEVKRGLIAGAGGLIRVGRLLPRPLALAELIAANSPLAVRLSKELVTLAPDLTLDEAWARNDEYAARIAQSEDMREGVRAFAEKRRPSWTGR